MSLQTQEVVSSQTSYQEVLQLAERQHRQSPDWVTFFREVLGIDGVVRKAFPKYEDLVQFEQSEEFDKIQQMLVKLREKRTTADSEAEPTRVITVRLPKSMHEYLRTEAHDLRTSMNKLCISKLLQVIGEDKIPNERSGGGSKSSKPVTPSAGAFQTTTGAAATLPPRTTPSLTGGSPQTQTPPPFKPTTPRF